MLDLGLNAAFDWQIAQFRERAGIDCELVECNAEIMLNDCCSTTLFRILQEALANVARHSHANWVRVDLRMEHERVWMSVCDNGIGMHDSVRSKPGSFGLIGIEERARILGGTLSISSSPGCGTTIEVALPAQSDTAHAGDAVQAAGTCGSRLR